MRSFVYLLELDLTAIKRTTVSGLTELSLKDTGGKTGNLQHSRAAWEQEQGSTGVQRRPRFLNSLEF